MPHVAFGIKEKSVSTVQPARRVARTIFQAIVGFAAMAPLIYSAATQHNPGEASGYAAIALAITGAITRIMALPQVDAFLKVFVPFLGSTPLEDDDYVPRHALGVEYDGSDEHDSPVS